MFSSNDTPAEEFIKCAELGGIINLDDITHIDFVLDALKDVDSKDPCSSGRKTSALCPADITRVESLRWVKVTRVSRLWITPGDAKYGMTEEQIIEAYKRLKELGVEELGIHSFLASNTL